MRVAFLIPAFPVVSETFISNQIIGLLDRGIDVHIHASSSGQATVHSSIHASHLLDRTFYRYGERGALRRIGRGLRVIARRGFDRRVLAGVRERDYDSDATSFRLLFALDDFVDAPAYDIIHCHFGPMGMLAAKLKQILNLDAKIVTTFHGYDLSKYIAQHGASSYRYLFEHGDLFLAVSDHLRERLIALGCPEQSVQVHHVGVDLRALHFHARRPTKDAVRILSVARLTEKKGIEYGIRAIASAVRNGYRVFYRIIGGGPQRKLLHKLIRRWGLSSSIELLGSKSEEEVRTLFYESDILLAPSVTARDGDKEGIPVTIMEGMATGMPVLSTQHSGIPEIVRDGKTGFLVKERDVEGLTERLTFLIDNPSIWEPMGRAGRKVVEDQFDSDRLNDGLVDIYHDLL